MSGWEAQRAQLRPAPVYPRDFTCTQVDLFCAPGSKGTLKKVRKDRRDTHSGRNLLEDNPRKLKERPSWMSISRQPSSNLAPAGSWRPVTSNVQDDAGQATLQVYSEDQHLLHSVHLNSLFAPNLRIVDPTLLMRRHVLAIHGHVSVNASSTSVSSPAAQEPIYLAFRDRDTVNAWLVLLRSFAHPDIRPYSYSPNFAPPPPNAYRIWRQLQVSIIAARKFHPGSPDKLYQDDASTHSKDSKEKDREKDTRWEAFVELALNGAPVGRTAAKPASGAAWHAERITVMDPDLGGGTWAGSGGAASTFTSSTVDVATGAIWPPASTSALLEARIWRSRTALFGPPASHIASVPIDLGPFRRGEAIRAWWPGFPAGSGGSQDGEIMLEIKLDEEVVLPLEMYRKMKEILARCNYFELWHNLTVRIPLLPLAASTHLISLALHHATLAPHLSALAHAEIDAPRASPSTLFRGNTPLTRAAEAAMAILGARGFLESSIGAVIRRMCREKVVFDVSGGGPMGVGVSGVGAMGGMGGMGVGGAGAGGLAEGADVMAYWLQEMWNSIWRARGECPEELRQLFYQIRTHIDARWGTSVTHADLKYQAISAFLFLRFFVPALLRPDQHALLVGPPPEGVEKSLKSLAKALQSLANLNTTVQREEFMRGVKNFNEENVDAMIDYLIFVSTPSTQLSAPIPSAPPPTPSSTHSHPSFNLSTSQPYPQNPQLYTSNLPRPSSPSFPIYTALRARLPAMSALQRESLPVLPHMADEARDLAALASVIVRNARAGREPGVEFESVSAVAGEGVNPRGSADLGVSGGGGARGGDHGLGGAADQTTPTQDDPNSAEHDVVRFIKACFDIEGEALRRVAPRMPVGVVRKHPRRRRRPKVEDVGAGTGVGVGVMARVEERMSVGGGSTPSGEGEGSAGGSAKGLVSPLLAPAPGMGGEYLSAYTEAMRAAGEVETKPEIMRQVSQSTVSDGVGSEVGGGKRRKGGMFRFMSGGSRK